MEQINEKSLDEKNPEELMDTSENRGVVENTDFTGWKKSKVEGSDSISNIGFEEFSKVSDVSCKLPGQIDMSEKSSNWNGNFPISAQLKERDGTNSVLASVDEKDILTHDRERFTQEGERLMPTPEERSFSTPEGERSFSTREGESSFSTPEGESSFSTPEGESSFSTTEGESPFSTPEGESSFLTPERENYFLPPGESSFLIPGGESSFSTHGESSSLTPRGESSFLKPRESSFLAPRGEISFLTPRGEIPFLTPRKESSFSTPSGESSLSIPRGESSFSTPQEQGLLAEKERSILTRQEGTSILVLVEEKINLPQTEEKPIVTLADEKAVSVQNSEKSILTQAELPIIKQPEETSILAKEKSTLAQKENLVLKHIEESILSREEERSISVQEDMQPLRGHERSNLLPAIHAEDMAKSSQDEDKANSMQNENSALTLIEIVYKPKFLKDEATLSGTESTPTLAWRGDEAISPHDDFRATLKVLSKSGTIVQLNEVVQVSEQNNRATNLNEEDTDVLGKLCHPIATFGQIEVSLATKDVITANKNSTLPKCVDIQSTNQVVEDMDIRLIDISLPVISQVVSSASVISVEQLKDVQTIVPEIGTVGFVNKTHFSEGRNEILISRVGTTLTNKDMLLEREADTPLNTATPITLDKDLARPSNNEKLTVVTPSFEEIPVIIKTEPQDDINRDENVNIDSQTLNFERQSETKAADVSLISDLEIDFNYCASCHLDFRNDPNETPKKLKSFSSFNTVSGDLKTVSILEALLLIFDLRFVKCCTAFHKEEALLQDISLCTQCAIMATQMYKLYTEFSELIHAESILSKLVNHENVLQNNAIAKAAAAKINAETDIRCESGDFSENLPNIRVRNPSEKQRKGVTSIFESDNESEEETNEVINGLESVRRSSLENRKRNTIEQNRRVSVSNDAPITLNINSTTISSRLLKPTHLRIKKEHGKAPVQQPKVLNLINSKVSQKPKRIFDIKQEPYVHQQPPRKIARGYSTDSVPSIVSVHSIANPAIVKDEAQPCSSSSLSRSLRPKRTSCKIVDYSKQLGEESELEDDDKDADAEIYSEDDFDDDPHDLDFSKKSKSKSNIILGKCAKKSKTKLSHMDIKRMFGSDRLLKELSLPNLFPLTCKICKKTFRDLVSLERHKKTHKAVSSFPCFICGIICWNQNIFLTHLGTHIPEKPFVCDCCNAAFKIKGELDQHKLRHQELIIFTCQQCKECFPSLMLLNRHEAAIHMKETSYICPMCPAVQFERSDWSKHVLTHSPFKCTKCDLFFNPNELKIHVQTFHPSPAPQKFQQPPLQQTQSIFSDLLRAASHRINH